MIFIDKNGSIFLYKPIVIDLSTDDAIHIPTEIYSKIKNKYNLDILCIFGQFGTKITNLI